MAPTQVAAAAALALASAAEGATLATGGFLERAGRNPGAGMQPEAIKPFEDYHKDGFSHVSCVLDSMLLHGDKHGDGKYNYKLGDVSNVSIIHYTDMVAKEDQKQMTHQVCYSFCRSIPQMSFFGITNGRDCYCTPFFKQMAGDSSDCDAVCDGDATTMCGGKSKSDIFEMHSCNDVASKLSAAVEAAAASGKALKDITKDARTLAEKMQGAATKLQQIFGKVGDAAATGHMQEAKKFAGELIHAVEDGEKLRKALSGLPRKAAADLAVTEGIVADLLSASKQANATTEMLEELKRQGRVPRGHKRNRSNAQAFYYSVMYFVDKNFTEVPTTCGGKAAAKPQIGTSRMCAKECETLGALKCKGFSFMVASGDFNGDGVCVLLSEVTSATYYTGCGAEDQDVKKENRAKKSDRRAERKSAGGKGGKGGKTSALAITPYMTQCRLKFSTLEGTSIKPDGSGKCKTCLKELTKADRCFEP